MADHLRILVVFGCVICVYKVSVDVSEKLTTSSENTCVYQQKVINFVLEVSVISVHERRLEIDSALIVYPKSDHRPYCVDGGGGGWVIHVVLLVVHRVEVVIFFLIKAL